MKERQLAEGARGFAYLDGYVCSECVDEPVLKAYIAANAVERECDYCGRRGKEAIAADADDLVDHVSRSLATEYSGPEDELYWDEGDWVGTVYWLDELLEDLDDPLGTGDFRDAVVAASSDRQYCDRDYYGHRQDEELRLDWELFVDAVKHQARFTFLWLPDGDKDQDMIRHGHAVRRGGRMLHEIGRLVFDLDLIRTLPAGTPLFRARTNNTGKTYTLAKDLGSAPSKKAATNRMSPAGIPMFYAASDRETALAEAVEPGDDTASVGRFETTSDAWIVDLDRIPDVPSIFDDESRDDRGPLRFLHGFRHDFVKAIERDGREHVEYVPTQIVTEYFRHHFQDPAGDAVDGIAYTSSQRPGGSCILLFADSDRCYDRDGRPKSSERLALELISYEHIKL